jgi:putative iron-dependent peroxidase
VTAGGANIVVGFSPGLWAQLDHGVAATAELAYPDDIPGLPRTQHDIWVWVHGTGDDVMLDVTRGTAALLAPCASLVSEIQGFVYHDSRDITGFVDGTENPPVEEAFEVAVVPDGSPGAGGSYAIAMKWVHDLTAFHALDEKEQEGVIGRTKRDSIELDDDLKPDTAHIARVVIEENGEELEIYRRSVPYGAVAEHGLFFVAFSADPTRYDKMLRRMFGAAGDGLHDRLTEFTKPVSGGYYFVPSLEALGNALG